jgi:hypothetical protein
MVHAELVFRTVFKRGIYFECVGSLLAGFQLIFTKRSGVKLNGGGVLVGALSFLGRPLSSYKRFIVLLAIFVIFSTLSTVLSCLLAKRFEFKMHYAKSRAFLLLLKED